VTEDRVTVPAHTRRNPTPAEMTLRGKKGAHGLHSKYDSRELTNAGRKASWDRFEKEVDPEGKLPEAERLRRAEHARRAFYVGMALKSVQARKRKK
jgi:hypothetical protein